MRKMPAKNATAGCVQRQRTSQPLVEEKSCAKAAPSELAGKSVSPSAASDPVTPTISTTIDRRNGSEWRDQANPAAQNSRYGG